MHNLCIDHFMHERQDGCTSFSFEICSGCREEIKTRLESLDTAPKKKNARAANEDVKTGPVKICDHNMEIEDGNPGEFVLKCTKCGEKGKA